MRLLSDLRFGSRLLAKSPAFSVTVVVILALAIGANTAIFGVVDALLLRPLPFPDEDRVVMVYEDNSRDGFPRNTPAPANYVDWEKQSTVFEHLAATRGMIYSITGDGTPENVIARRVTADFWKVFALTPAAGRVFTEDEETRDEKVAVIAHGLWQRRYGGDRSIVGKKILLNDEPHVVVGVLPRAFVFPSRATEIFTPSGFTPELLARRGSHFLLCVGKLKPNVSDSEATAELKTIMKRLEAEYPDHNRGISALVVPMREFVVGNLELGIALLAIASLCVLLIACANVANLLLVRAADRQREMAVRSSLGAGRGLLLRQMLTESAMLAGFGAVAGVAVAWGCQRAMETFLPTRLPAESLSVDPRMLGFALAATIATTMLCGLFPALTATRGNLQELLKQASRTSAGGRSHRFRDGLVVLQVSLALALVAGAALMIQTLQNLDEVDLGFEPGGLATFNVNLPDSRYPAFKDQREFFVRAKDRLATIPGVEQVAYTSNLPVITFGNTSSYAPEGGDLRPGRGFDALYREVSFNYFQTIGAKLHEGRFFTEDDRAGTVPVVLVNETLAGARFPGQSAVGKRIAFDRDPETGVQWLTIVGVVKEIRERGITADLKDAVYVPNAQGENAWPEPQDFVLRTSVDPLSVAEAARRAIWELDKDQPVEQFRAMDTLGDQELAPRRGVTSLLLAYGLLALLLAAVGIYGVLAYLVKQTSRETGIRVALGATPMQIVARVLRTGGRLALFGVVGGIILFLAGSRWIKGILHGVQAADPATLAAVSTVLLLIAVTACTLPALRAARVDPMAVLREE